MSSVLLISQPGRLHRLWLLLLVGAGYHVVEARAGLEAPAAIRASADAVPVLYDATAQWFLDAEVEPFFERMARDARLRRRSYIFLTLYREGMSQSLCSQMQSLSVQVLDVPLASTRVLLHAVEAAAARASNIASSTRSGSAWSETA